MVSAVSEDVSERYLDFKRGLWLPFAAHDIQFMTTAIDNSTCQPPDLVQTSTWLDQTTWRVQS